MVFTLSVLRAVRELKALQPRIPLPAEQVSGASTMPAKMLHSVLRAVRELKAPPRIPLPADLPSPMGVVVSVMVHTLSVLRAVRELKAQPRIPLPADQLRATGAAMPAEWLPLVLRVVRGH